MLCECNGADMDALKFAFDTLIIGALALPWLAVLLHLYSLPPINGKAGKHTALLSALPEHTKDVVLSAAILALGYFLGAAVSRVSDDFFGDADLWSLPTEPSIRDDVYHHEYCDVSSVVAAANLPYGLAGPAVLFCSAKVSEPSQPPKPGSPERPKSKAGFHEEWGDAITQFFRLEEGRLLLQGDDKTTRLRELHDQIVILRGATLNGMMLTTLCLLGLCASYRHGSSHWLSFGSTYVPAIALLVYGVFTLVLHFQHFRSDPDLYRDPPLAEGLMVIMGLAGLAATAPPESRLKYAHGCGVSFALTIVAYGRCPVDC
jgi:hypothetical protein